MSDFFVYKLTLELHFEKRRWDPMALELMREYETIYVMRPELDDKEAKELMLGKKAIIEQLGGKNLKVTALGRRKLAWETKKETRGTYVHHRFLGMPGIIKDFDRDLSIDDRILIRQSVILGRNIDPNLAQIEEDVLTPPVFRERRDSGDRRNRDHYDDGERGMDFDMGQNVSPADINADYSDEGSEQ